MLPSFANDSITIVEPAWSVDARNVRKPDYGAAATRSVVTGCSVQPGASPELVAAGRSTTTIRYTVLAPPAAAASASSGVEYLGKLYAVDGEPLRQPSATGALDHVVLLLIDWK